MRRTLGFRKTWRMQRIRKEILLLIGNFNFGICLELRNVPSIYNYTFIRTGEFRIEENCICESCRI